MIVDEWEEFAATQLPAATEMTVAQLRDEAGELLDAAADDLESKQTGVEQKEKSRGEGKTPRLRRVAQSHAILRMQAGFRLDQVLSEFRALRATVVRKWDESSPDEARREITRFNEAIDEALTESINRFSDKLEEYRDQFLAVLGTISETRWVRSRCRQPSFRGPKESTRSTRRPLRGS
jgi:hypothetical protein